MQKGPVEAADSRFQCSGGRLQQEFLEEISVERRIFHGHAGIQNGCFIMENPIWKWMMPAGPLFGKPPFD